MEKLAASLGMSDVETALKLRWSSRVLESFPDSAMFESILSSKLVQEAVAKVAAQEKVPRDVVEERAARDLQELVRTVRACAAPARARTD